MSLGLIGKCVTRVVRQSPAARITAILLCGCLSLTATGCATLHLPFGKDRMEKATARNPVVQIICIWEPSEGRDPNGMPCRGFAGQVLFLAGRNSLPVQVEGDVRIYLFDDQGPPEEQTKPLHQYDFDSGSWSVHLTKGTLGPTYSVFVPYTRRGTYEAKCALRVRLKTGDQPAVFSDMATIPLDGRTNTKKTTDLDGQLPSAEAAQAATEAVSQTMRRTTTISMTGETAKPNTKSSPVQTAALATRAEEAAGRVQLANYEDGAESSDPGTQRIEQLEQLVQQLLKQQSCSTSEQAPRAARCVTPASAVAPAESSLHESSLESNRLRLKGRDATHTNSGAARAAHPLDALHEQDSASVESAAPARLAIETAKHPLGDFDDDAAQPIRRAVQPRRETATNHPLAGLEDELVSESLAPPTPARREARQSLKSRAGAVPATRTILANETESRTASSWGESFDPIDTSTAIGTWTVEAEPQRSRH